MLWLHLIASDKWCIEGGIKQNVSTDYTRVQFLKTYNPVPKNINLVSYVNNSSGYFAFVREIPTATQLIFKANTSTIDKVYWSVQGFIL